jgi:ParB family chromosome partitioning protein
MTDDEGAAHAKLLAEYRALKTILRDRVKPDDIDMRLGVFEADMEKIETRPLMTPAEG